MLVSEQEILELRDFIVELNTVSNSAVVVEGKRDSKALRKLGYNGKILEFHRFGRIINFADSAANYHRLIILFNKKKKGRILTRKTIQLLQRRTNVDLSFRRKIHAVTKGKIMFIEQLIIYESLIA